MDAATLLLFACLVPLAFLAVLMRYQTALLGLTFMNAFHVASASLSAFLFDGLTGLPMDWFTVSHATVIEYSVVGGVAMALGTYLAWRPLVGARLQLGDSYPPMPAWINPASGWFMFAVGIGATVALIALRNVPTVSTALDCLKGLTGFGLFVLLLVALRVGMWGPFVLALALVLPVLLAGSLASGHTPLPVGLLIPVSFIVSCHRRVSFRSFVLLGVAAVFSVLLMKAWMSTRGIIRSGALSELGMVGKADTFLPDFINKVDRSALGADSIHGLLRERIDASDLLAEQQIHQPAHEPYAMGGTFLEAFIGLVPRALWPEKPQIAGGSEFVGRFTGIVRAEDDTTSVGLPYQFELYANGGPWLVVIGLFAIGYLSGRLELGLFRNFSCLGKLLALAVATLTVCDGGQRMNVVMPSLVAAVLSAYILGWCLEHLVPKFTSRVLGRQRFPDLPPAGETGEVFDPG